MLVFYYTILYIEPQLFQVFEDVDDIFTPDKEIPAHFEYNHNNKITPDNSKKVTLRGNNNNKNIPDNTKKVTLRETAKKVASGTRKRLKKFRPHRFLVRGI